MKKRLKPYLKVLEELNLEIVDTTMTGSQHFKMRVRSGDAKRFFIVPNSTSDRRALLNWRTDVRRWLTELEG